MTFRAIELFCYRKKIDTKKMKIILVFSGINIASIYFEIKVRVIRGVFVSNELSILTSIQY